MKICFLLGGFKGIGGIGRVVSILANKTCKDTKYKIYTISFYDSEKDNQYKLDDRINQINLYDKPITMKKAILEGGVLKLRKLIKANDIDILIGCGALYYPIVILSAIGLSIKTICWEHSNAENDKDHSFQMMSRKFGAKFADYIVTLTKHDKEIYKEKFNTKKITQIYNPIDEVIINYQEDYEISSKKIISVGRFSYQKNFELLIDVASKVLKNNPNWTWDIYGDGETKDIIKEKIAGYSLNDRICLKGNVSNLYEMYSKYSFLVMTSRYEGFPMSLLEGIAIGLPLVSFDVLTGPKEIISDGINGYLVEPFNIDSMVEKIETLINDDEKRINMSQQSKIRSGDFRINTIIDQWTKLFDNILNKGEI